MNTDPITELLSRQIPDKLWHYSSVKGFYGIVTSKAIYASDIRFLNDVKEFIHAREIASEVAADVPEFGSNLFPVREYWKKAVDIAFGSTLRPDRTQVFVASFSVAEDQLSQWRGYSRGSSGVSLGLRLSAFRPPPNVDTLVCFAPCVYDLSDKKTLIRRALDHFMNEAQGYWDATAEAFLNKYDGPRPIGKNPSAVFEFISRLPGAAELNQRLTTSMASTKADLLHLAALLKDKSFCEEQEWRLVLPVSAGKQLQNPRRFRPEGTTLVPYISYPFPLGSDGALPLVDVILGPGGHPNATQAAFSFLLSEGVRVKPRESTVPYRPL